MEHEHIYRAKLDFLYQSIAVYAATIVIYLLVRGLFATNAFPSFWQDPLLLMLCAITLISVLALIYNLLLHRQIEVTSEEIRFMSRARRRSVGKNDIRYMQFGRERGPVSRKGVRIVKMVLKERRRPVRIRIGNFEHGRQLLHDLKEWAGPLAMTRRQVRQSERNDNGPSLEARHPIA